MDIVRVIGIGLISLIIIIILKQHKPEIAMYASLIGGCLILFIVFEKIGGIIDLFYDLSRKTSINNQFIILLVKITGIAILTEFAVSICKDAGESAIASKVDLGGKIIIIGISIPIITALLETLITILP